MHCLRASRLVLPLALVLLAPATARAGGLSLDMGGIKAGKQIRTFQDIREAQVVRQKWDMSCGSAALSTLLTYHLADPVPEAQIIVSILRRTDPVKVRARGGFSLLDLKRFSEMRGYEAKGYAGLTIVDLMTLGPAVVPVRIQEFDHFVLFRQVHEDRVILSDPAFGNLTMRVPRFEEIWKGGVGFIVRRRIGTVPPDELALQTKELPIPDAEAMARLVRGVGVSTATRRGP